MKEQPRYVACCRFWSALVGIVQLHKNNRDGSVLVSADDIFCLQQGADSRSSGILKSDAIVVHFTPKILQKLITQLETEPF